MAITALISDWAAWAPGLTSPEDWREYFNGQKELNTDSKPDVKFLPALFRRRLSPLNRMIFAASTCLKDQTVLADCPVIFTSRHGELSLSLKLINSILSSGAISPAGFSMSVHNSAAGLLSIYHGNTRAMTAVAAGEKSLKMGLIETVSQVSAADRSVLIFADENMPAVYSQFESSQKYPACLILTVEKNEGNHVIDTSMDCAFEDIVRYLAEQP